MDTRAFFFAVLIAIVVAAGCNKQERESEYSTAQAPVKGTEKPVVPANPETDKDHGNAAAQKGGSPHSGTAEPQSPPR